MTIDPRLTRSSDDRSDLCEITLHLERIEHLFQAPELNPFAGQNHALSGIEEILNEIKPRSPNCQICTTIFLPLAQLSEDLEQTCQTAIWRYCDAKIHQINNEMMALRQ